MSASRTSRYIIMVLAVTVLASCQRQVVEPEYSRPLPPGASALRKLPLSQWPSLDAACFDADTALVEAARRSAAWFNYPSTQAFFPLGPISHERAHASVLAFIDLAQRQHGPALVGALQKYFDLYQSVGWNGGGDVLFTGYYSPVFDASRKPTGAYRYPLYRRPDDLVSDEQGNILGRRVGNITITYPTRREIETGNLLAGDELVYLKDKLDAYLIHIQGSAKLRMADGTTLFIGYAGNNGHEYRSMARQLVADGKLAKNHAGLKAIRAYFQSHPQELDHYLQINDRFVFFREYDGSTWPAGSLGFQVTAGRTLATDKQVYPRAGVVLVRVGQDDQRGTDLGGVGRSIDRFMLDQDTGGAIRAPGRGDIYYGTGDDAQALAGDQYAVGQLYYLFLKPEFIDRWLPAPAPGSLNPGTPSLR